jgi:tight adherence protein B
MIVSPAVLLCVALLILTGFGFSGVLVSRAQAAEKRFAERCKAVLQPHIRKQPIDIALFARPPESETSAKVWLASWFGIDLERPDISPVPWWIIVAGAVVAAQVASTGAASLFGPFAWLGFPVVCIVTSRTVFDMFKSKRRNRLLLQFPDALMMIVRSVRVGVPVTQAIHIIAREQPYPTSIEFARLASQLSIGEPLDTAILDMARHAGLAEYRFFATALTLQSKAGGALSGTLENLADMIRRRVAVKERAHALASEARMSIYVLTGLPVAVGGALALLSPQYIGVLVTDSLGNKLLVAAVMLLGSGIGAMKFIVKKSTS